MQITIPDFIIDIVNEGVHVRILPNGFMVDGFYKSGSVDITPNEDDTGWIATARYNEKSMILNTSDIVSLNYDWWQRGKDSFNGWKNPAEGWGPLFVKYGYDKAVTVPAKVVYEEIFNG